MAKISYLLSSVDGFGHVSRAIQIANVMENEAPDLGLEFLVHRSTHKFLRENVRNKNHSIHHLDYQKGNGLTGERAENIRRMSESDVILTDWVHQSVPLVEAARQGGRNPLFVGLYHANLKPSEGDTPEVTAFRKKQKELIEKQDLYIHTTIEPDSDYSSTSTPVVPVPLIVRGSKQSPIEIKSKLGLRPDQKFIYAQIGGKANNSMRKRFKGKKNYEVFFDRMNKLDPKKLGVDKIVVNTAGRKFNFTNKNIVAVDFVPNGQDYVRAAELMIGKPGMGVLAEAFKFGTPFLMFRWDLVNEEQEKLRMLKEATDNYHPTVWGRSLEHITERISLTLRRRAELSDMLSRTATNGAEVTTKILKRLEQYKQITPEIVEELLSLTPYKKDVEGKFTKKPVLEGKDYSRVRMDHVVKLATAGLEEKARLLEVGCNTGIISFKIGKKGFDTTGIDLSNKVLEQARERAKNRKNICYEKKDAYNLTYQPNSFDSVVLTEILEHIDDPERAIEEALRVTRKGGKLVISVPKGAKIQAEGHKLFYTPESLVSLLSKYSDIVEFRNAPGINRHMHVVVRKTREPEQYEKRKTLYDEVQEILYKEMPEIPLYAVDMYIIESEDLVKPQDDLYVYYPANTQVEKWSFK